MVHVSIIYKMLYDNAVPSYRLESVNTFTTNFAVGKVLVNKTLTYAS
jgi:hypothetical protein